MFYTILISILLIIIGYLYFNKKPSRFPPIPGPKRSFITSILAILKPNYTTRILETSKQFPGMYDCSNIIFHACMVHDPALVKEMTMSNYTQFMNHPGFDMRSQKLLTMNSMMSLKDEAWKDRRRLLSPYFGSTKISPLVETFCHHGEILCNKLKKGLNGKTEMRQLMANSTLDILGDTVFGASFNAQEDENNLISKDVNDWIVATQKMSILPFVPFWDKLPLKVVRDFIKGQDRLVSICKKVVQTRKENNEKREDILQALMDNSNETELLADALLFLVAGHETTATTLSWAIYCISQNKEIEKKLVEELNRELKGSPPTSENIHKLQYLDCIVQETLRFYPAAMITTRESNSSSELGGYTFPPKTIFLLPIWAIHHNDKYWKNPETFDPERFNNENKGKIIEGSFLPFGLGPRMCIGYKFSLMETKVLLAMMYQQFSFEYAGTGEPVTEGISLFRPKEVPVFVHPQLQVD